MAPFLPRIPLNWHQISCKTDALWILWWFMYVVVSLLFLISDCECLHSTLYCIKLNLNDSPKEKFTGNIGESINRHGKLYTQWPYQYLWGSNVTYTGFTILASHSSWLPICMLYFLEAEEFFYTSRCWSWIAFGIYHSHFDCFCFDAISIVPCKFDFGKPTTGVTDNTVFQFPGYGETNYQF